MGEIRITRYKESDAREWDDFVGRSRNSTFLSMRGYMDYHSDRFKDYSLMARKGERLIAVLPANIIEDHEGNKVLQSHGGLTYGGWILPPRHFDATDMMDIFDALKDFAVLENISALDYKSLPSIYALMPSQEDRYALFRNGAQLTELNISSAIDLKNNPGFNKLRKRDLKKNEDKALTIGEIRELEEFHNLLTECLKERHSVEPVHSISELGLLKERFPDNIKIFGMRSEEGLEAGVALYITQKVAHAQYICSSSRGREAGLLAILFDYLIKKYTGEVDYFDFGISNEDHGRYLNEGLNRQKASLGGSGVSYERYFLPLK